MPRLVKRPAGYLRRARHSVPRPDCWERGEASLVPDQSSTLFSIGASDTSPDARNDCDSWPAFESVPPALRRESVGRSGGREHVSAGVPHSPHSFVNETVETDKNGPGALAL